jgi:hypothetical protein
MLSVPGFIDAVLRFSTEDSGVDVGAIRKEIADAEKLLAKLEEDYYDPQPGTPAMRTDTYQKVHARHTGTIQDARRRLREALDRRSRTDVKILTGDPIWAGWPDLDVPTQRTIVRAAVRWVTIHPLGKGQLVTPEHFVVRWATSEIPAPLQPLPPAAQ